MINNLNSFLYYKGTLSKVLIIVFIYVVK